jgi:transcriptional regulator with XRE-family HTH domain
MENKSKEILKSRNITYKEIALLLNISERQAMNILNKENKALYNYLAISYISNTNINDLFQLSEEEKKNIRKRLEIISNL